MDAAAYALQSDPTRNRHFSRRWDLPPWRADSRKRRPRQGGSADLDGTIVNWNDTDNNETLRQAQRADAERLFERVA